MTSEIPEGKPDQKMAIQGIIKEIEVQAEQKAKKILENAKLEEKKILADAKEEGTRLKKEILNKARSEANNTKVQEISRKKLSLKMDYLKVREQIFNEINVEIKSKLQEYTQSSEYSQFMKDLLKSSAMVIGGGSLTMYLRSEDKSHYSEGLLKEISKEVSDKTSTPSEIKVSSDDLNTIGGLKLVRDDGLLFIDNTFEARLKRNEEDIRITILDILTE